VIPALLHGRLLGGGGGGGGGIIASPSYLSVSAQGTGGSVAHATATFTVDPDGTWASTANQNTVTDERSGNWYLPTTAAAGDAHEVRITPTKAGGDSAVITNPAADWVPASVARTLQLKLSRYTAGSSFASYDVLVEFRPAGGGAVVSSGEFAAELQVDVG
jgi:hypothetical protein